MKLTLCIVEFAVADIGDIKWSLPPFDCLTMTNSQIPGGVTLLRIIYLNTASPCCPTLATAKTTYYEL